MSDHSAEGGSVHHAVLLAPLRNITSPPTYLASAISTAVTSTADRLCIVLCSPYFEDRASFPRSPAEELPDLDLASIVTPSHILQWEHVQRLLTYVYVQATKVAQDLDNVLMDVDVLLKGTSRPLPQEVFVDAELVYSVQSPDRSIHYALPPSAQTIPARTLLLAEDLHLPPPLPPPADASPPPPPLPVAALGGTFDHLHPGHKILLSTGAWLASEKLIVGITDDALLVKKANRDVLESIAVRMQRVRSFLELFRPRLEYDIVPISDVYGPTAWDPNIQALIVSRETLPGASSIHKIRQEKSLPPLRTFVIDVISATDANLDDKDAEELKKAKLSSTYIREWIVRHQANGAA